MLNAEISTRPATAAAFEVIPAGAALGAEVGAGDLRTLDHAGFARVLEARRAHAVVLFRSQALSDQGTRWPTKRANSQSSSNPMKKAALRLEFPRCRRS